MVKYLITQKVFILVRKARPSTDTRPAIGPEQGTPLPTIRPQLPGAPSTQATTTRQTTSARSRGAGWGEEATVRM